MLWVRARRGNLHDAVAHARKAFGLAPHDPFLRWRVGTIWQGVGVYAAALESFEEAVGLAPEFHVARAGLAIELARAGRSEAMREHEARAGGLLDGRRLGSQLALAQAEGGDLAGARTRLEALARRHPGDRFVARAADKLERPAGTRSAEGPEGPNPQEEGT